MVVFTDPCANIPQSQVGRSCPRLLCYVRDFMFAGKGRQQPIARIMCRECRSLGFIIAFTHAYSEVLTKWDPVS